MRRAPFLIALLPLVAATCSVALTAQRDVSAAAGLLPPTAKHQLARHRRQLRRGRRCHPDRRALPALTERRRAQGGGDPSRTAGLDHPT